MVRLNSAEFSVETLEANSSSFLRRHLQRIVDIDDCNVLDAPCGTGRNALYLQSLGLSVTGFDISAQAIQTVNEYSKCIVGPSVDARVQDLADWPWKAADAAFDVILSVHFVMLEVIPHFAEMLEPNGLLLIESFGNRGENFRQLPVKNSVREILEKQFHLIEYKEKKAGPYSVDAVTVRCLAVKL